MEPPAGGYQTISGGGFEVLLNYYSSTPIAASVPLREILSGSRDRELSQLVRDRVVLIGNIDPNFKDYHQTPYSWGQGKLKVNTLC